MSKASHELAIRTALDAIEAALEANDDLAGGQRTVVTLQFPQEDLDSNFTAYFENHPTLRGRVLDLQAINITTDITAGGTIEVGTAGNTDAYVDTTTFALTADNTNDATDLDGVGDFKRIMVEGDDVVIPADQLAQVLATDVSTDTGVFDLIVVLELFV